ncbi:MAG: TonB-dependent receptor [Acidobacteria bacterium]|nr:TonB-dependent receptor [Acidobacteriota bacterium]
MLNRGLRLFALALGSMSLLPAQTAGTATLVGTISDSTGAIVVAAKVTVVNQNTSFVSEAVTNNEGAYYVPYLAPGTYRLTAEAAGFKKHQREGIVLRTGEMPRLDIALEVGAVTESVQVTGAPPLLDTETATSGQVLDGDLLVKVPVSQKRAIRILFYMPGANAIGGFTVLGQRARAMGYTVDGINGKEPGIGATNGTDAQISTTQDAFEEVKLYTTGAPAELGHSAGGLMSIVFKSGTNQFHGSAENRYINKQMIHRNFLEQLPRTNPFTYHETTFLFTGPMILPKLYKGRDKTFWLAGWERHYENAGTSSARTTVPTEAMLNGDFSFGGQTSPRPLPIYNPFTTRQEGANWLRDPFPGNIIPRNMFDPAVVNFLGRDPFTKPNGAGFATASGPSENLVMNQIKQIRRTRWDAKIDHQFSSAHKIFGRYSHAHHRAWKGDYQAQFNWRDIDPNAQPAPVDHINIVFSDMLILSPSMNNEFRAGMNRRARYETALTRDQDWAKQLGIPNVSGATFPYFNIGYGFAGLPSFQNVGEDFTFQDNLTKIAGKHTFKFGYELIRTRYNGTAGSLPGGTYNFTGTNQPFTPNTGIGFANFLLGTVGSAVYTQEFASWLPRWWSHQWYAQTDYKPVRNLTLNLGVRWSYESPFGTKYGQQSQFDPNVKDPISGLMGAITHPKGALAKRDLNNFAPRIGLAWNFHPSMVFRGSYGIVHQDIFATGTNILFQEYLANATVQSPVGDPRHAFRLSQGPPSFQYDRQADGSVPFIGNNFAGRGANWWDPNMRMPYVQSWSAGVQWGFAQNFVLDMQYQGQSGVGLINSWDMNVIPLDISRDLNVLNQIFTASQNYKPYRQFGGISHFSNYGHNTYHGGTIRVEKRYSGGLSFNAFYTYAKTLNETEADSGDNGVTFYNRRLEKGRSSTDIRHRFVSVMSYELPFGRGRKFMNQGALLNHVLGGWELTWTQTFQSGQPFTVGFGGSPNRYLNGEARPNILTTNEEAQVKNWDIGANRFPTSAQNPYLKFSSFAYPAAFTPGTLGRNTFEGPGLTWTQLSIAKWWNIAERARIQLRLDANNFFPVKQPNYSNPSSTFNANNPLAFGTGFGTRGSFSDVGTSNSHILFVMRFQF